MGSYADFGWYLTLKSVSDPCQSTNRKRTFEIDSFRTISCGIGKELSFWQRRTGGFKCFSDYARDTIIDGNFGYKWTITCVLVVRNMQKGTTLIDGNHYKCGENCSKIRVIPRDPHVSSFLEIAEGARSGMDNVQAKLTWPPPPPPLPPPLHFLFLSLSLLLHLLLLPTRHLFRPLLDTRPWLADTRRCRGY